MLFRSGGSDAFVVLDDADLDHTVEMAILGRFGNNGQTCIGAKRFIVVKSMWDKFLPRFIAAAKKLKLGDPLDETVTLGPVSSDAALQLILRQIQEATNHGAQVALGGRRVGDVGAFLEPTILTNVTPDNPAYKQEFFGPAALVFPAKDEDEAIAIANDSPFGLGGSVYSSNIERASEWRVVWKRAWSSSTIPMSVFLSCLSEALSAPGMAKNFPTLALKSL